MGAIQVLLLPATVIHLLLQYHQRLFGLGSSCDNYRCLGTAAALAAKQPRSPDE